MFIQQSPMYSQSILPSDGTSAPSLSRASKGFEILALQSSTTRDMLQSIVKGRRNWKTLRDGEVIWPPELEAALLGGLEAYQPNYSRETRMLGRFPMRNRFISDYIYRKTGTRRTAKQIGSRLQQLRDTHKGEDLKKLLSPSSFPGSTYNDFNQPSYSLSEASMPVGAPMTIVSINILPQHVPSSYEPCSGTLDWGQSNIPSHPLSRPRPLYMIDPTVTFVTPLLLSARSSFEVYMAGVIVHSETTNLTHVGQSPDRADGTLLYSTLLVPTFWRKILESPDPAQYIIAQDVVQDTADSQSILFSAVYRFNYSSGDQNVTSRSMEQFGDEFMHSTQASTPMNSHARPGSMGRESYYNPSSSQNQHPGRASRSL